MMNIEIIGGGTISHVRNHLALCAPAYGTTASKLTELFSLAVNSPFSKYYNEYDVTCHLTKMARSYSKLETNEDVSHLLDELIANPETKIIVFNPALVDYEGAITQVEVHDYDFYSVPTASGKYEARLKTSEGSQRMLLTPAKKIISKIRKERKDIFLIGFKTTCGATQDEQFLTGLHLLKTTSCNLVLANDTKTRINMIITPEQARYSVTDDRDTALKELVSMTLSRSAGHFTRSTVVEGAPISWNSHLIPPSLRVVVDHCIKNGAYKPFNGSTVGHFAVKVNKTDFITSKRKVDFNKLPEVGMVLCRAEDDNSVITYGAKPSVGGQSQRIVFAEHPEMDCIVHFHCPVKYPAELSVRSQKEHECGSHECGQNTSRGLREEVPGIKCVYLDNHGPNIVFNRNTDPYRVIAFINNHFDLSKSTDQVTR